MIAELFLSLIRSTGDTGAVFEADDETAYLYRCAITPDGELSGITDAVHVWSGQSELLPTDIALRSSHDQRWAGIFIQNALWAVVNLDGGPGMGGDYQASGSPAISPDIAAQFTIPQ